MSALQKNFSTLHHHSDSASQARFGPEDFLDSPPAGVPQASRRIAQGHFSFRSSDLPEQLEEGAFALGVQSPVDRRRLVAVAVIVFPGIEITPGRVLGYRGHEIIRSLIESEVVVLVEEDRLGR